MIGKGKSEEVLKRVLTAPDEEFPTLTVNRLTEIFETDRFRISRLFKKERGITLEDFLFKERLTRAANILLTNSRITVKEVAEILGYCNSDYFIQVFRKHYGLAPDKYREYRTRRSEIKDRRGGGDRRRKEEKRKIPKEGDRREGLKDRREGMGDRRGPDSGNEKGLEAGNRACDGKRNGNGNGNGSGKTCEECKYKRYALKKGMGAEFE